VAAAIEAEFGVVPEVVEGARGAFEVFADGRRLFSKLAQGRFPEDDEVLSLLKAGAAR
jgi:selT/selW/selH-like putative selenoprotein